MLPKSQSYYLVYTLVTVSDYKECGLERKLKIIIITRLISILLVAF